MQKCLFVGGPIDGQSKAADPPSPVVFRATETGDGYKTWHYDCHLFVVGHQDVPVYVVSGLNMELAKTKALQAINSAT